MLTGDLLVTRTSKGKIEPAYAPIDQEHMEIARSVIDIFQRHVGKTCGELSDEIDDLEEMNYRLIRGLAALLERMCTIEIDSIIDPIVARRAVFEECKEIVTDMKERQKVLDRAASKLSIKVEQLENALWADLEENLVIRDFQAVSAEKLLRQYNLSLAQTLLFRATGMEIQIAGNYQDVFRKIKHLGLMYSIEQDRIYLDGPVSIFKLTERYGTALAKLLPSILRSGKWSLKAKILKKTFQGKRVLDFFLDDTRQIFNTEIFDETFDSAIEKEFCQFNFNGWLIRREPAVLKAGRHAFIPDFSLERDGCRIYVEIVGFWTPEYLKNKIQKINQLKENLILLVDRNLACSGSEFKTGNLIFYDRKIPYLEIIRILRKYEEEQQLKELTKLENIELSLAGSVINISDLAGRYGVGAEVLKKVVNRSDNDYLLFGNQLVDQQTLKKIQNELSSVKKHSEAVKIFENYGIRAHNQVLGFFGYKVKWNGLDPEAAEIY